MDAWEPAWGQDENLLALLTEEMAELFFISDNEFTFSERDDYDLGFLPPASWWPLAQQLDELVDLSQLLEWCHALDGVLGLDGLPTEVLEAPLIFLRSCLEGELPPEPSGQPVSDHKLVQIAQAMIPVLRLLPPEAQSAVRAWADVYRHILYSAILGENWDEEDLADLLFSPDLPPALTGFSMIIALTLSRWPERARGIPIPQIIAPEMYDQVLQEWESLPDTPPVTEEGEGEAEAFFAQARMAHLLSQLGASGPLRAELTEEDSELLSQVYSRLSRAVLWLHDHCRRCPEREGITCRAAVGGPVLPMPLLDVAAEMANTNRIVGCVKM